MDAEREHEWEAENVEWKYVPVERWKDRAGAYAGLIIVLASGVISVLLLAAIAGWLRELAKWMAK